MTTGPGGFVDFGGLRASPDMPQVGCRPAIRASFNQSAIPLLVDAAVYRLFLRVSIVETAD
jgi:hypothetical protein